MGGSCTYFRSRDWDRRLARYVGRAWDFETVVRQSETLSFERPLLEAVATSFGDVGTSELAASPIGEVVEAVDRDVLDVTMADVRSLWVDQNGGRLPDECPHDATGDTPYCEFHLHPDEYGQHGLTDESVRDSFLELVSQDGERAKTFVGARFGTLDLSNEVLDAPDHHAIDLRYAEIFETLDCSEAVFGETLRLKGSRLGAPQTAGGPGTASASNQFVGYEGDADFLNTRFHETADFKFVVFDGSTRFNGARFEGDGMFNYARFVDEVDFMGARFTGKADFSKASFDETAYLNGQYDGAALFNYTTFGEDLHIWSTEFASKAEFWAMTVEGRLNGEFATFREDTRFSETTFEGGASFRGAEFESDIAFKSVVVPDSWLDLSHARLDSGTLEQSPEATTYYDLTRATVGDVTLEGGEDAISCLRIYQTTFDGFDFAEHAEELRPGWELLSVPDEAPPLSNPETSDRRDVITHHETTYLKAKNGATRAGHNKAASEFFRKEMFHRRRHHAATFWSDPLSFDGAGAAWRWLANAFLDYTTGYGERPRRVAMVSVGTLVVFALFYLVTLESRESMAAYGQEVLLLSIQSFTTFILGNSPSGSSRVLELLTALEGLIGAFLIALLVFTLTRSIHR